MARRKREEHQRLFEQFNEALMTFLENASPYVLGRAMTGRFTSLECLPAGENAKTIRSWNELNGPDGLGARLRLIPKYLRRQLEIPDWIIGWFSYRPIVLDSSAFYYLWNRDGSFKHPRAKACLDKRIPLNYVHIRIVRGRIKTVIDKLGRRMIPEDIRNSEYERIRKSCVSLCLKRDKVIVAFWDTGLRKAFFAGVIDIGGDRICPANQHC